MSALLLNDALIKCVVTEVLFSNIDLRHDISQGSVATHLRCSGIFSDNIVTNVLLILTVKKVWKLVNIWWICKAYKSVPIFLGHRVCVIKIVSWRLMDRSSVDITLANSYTFKRQLWAHFIDLFPNFFIAPTCMKNRDIDVKFIPIYRT